MPRFGVGRRASARRPDRDDAVDAQYHDAAAAAGYAAAHDGWSSTARYFHSRLYLVQDLLQECAGGDLLDVGCGPGMLLRRLLDTRPGDFRLTACDRSPSMVEAARARVADAEDVRLRVARIEDLPFPDASFDVVVAMGVLEYSDAVRGLPQVARVVRPGGLVLVTMLNPLSPYRLFEWVVYWPARRVLGRIERVLRVREGRRHGARFSGIRSFRAATLRRMMRDVHLPSHDVVYYDLTPLVPPFDKIARRSRRQWRAHPEQTVSRGRSRWLGTAYLIAARRSPENA